MSNPSNPAVPPLTLEQRKARKLERRAKQREANVGRAGKMHKERLAQLLTETHDPDLPSLQVGCSGWFYWHWRGIFYPETMPTAGWFPAYREKFGTVELNAPFYSWPTMA